MKITVAIAPTARNHRIGANTPRRSLKPNTRPTVKVASEPDGSPATVQIAS